MWWLVRIEVPDLGEALAYVGGKDGVHQFFLSDGTPTLDRIEAYTAIDTTLSQPAWWVAPTPPDPIVFWEEN